MKCPDCCKKMVKMSSVGVEREDDLEEGNGPRIESIIYQQCMNKKCENNEPYPLDVKEEGVKLW